MRETIVNALTPDELRHVDMDAEIENFQRLLKLDSVKGALNRSRYDRTVAGLQVDEVCVENERRISLIIDNQLIDGTIDRLVVMKHQGRVVAAEILDTRPIELIARLMSSNGRVSASNITSHNCARMRMSCRAC